MEQKGGRPSSMSKTYYLGEHQLPFRLNILFNPSFFPQTHIDGAIILLEGMEEEDIKDKLRDSLLEGRGRLGRDLSEEEVLAVYLFGSSKFADLRSNFRERGFEVLEDPLVNSIKEIVERVYQNRKQEYRETLLESLSRGENENF